MDANKTTEQNFNKVVLANFKARENMDTTTQSYKVKKISFDEKLIIGMQNLNKTVYTTLKELENAVYSSCGVLSMLPVKAAADTKAVQNKSVLDSITMMNKALESGKLTTENFNQKLLEHGVKFKRTLAELDEIKKAFPIPKTPKLDEQINEIVEF